MIRGLINLVGAAVERPLRGFLLVTATAAGTALFALVSLGFGTFTAYLHLRASEGPVAAALIICAAFALLAGATWVIGTVGRRRASRRLPGATTVASAPASARNADPLASSDAAGSSRDDRALAAAMRLGRELSPVQLLTAALIGGFIAGRKLK